MQNKEELIKQKVREVEEAIQEGGKSFRIILEISNVTVSEIIDLLRELEEELLGTIKGYKMRSSLEAKNILEIKKAYIFFQKIYYKK